MATGAGGDTGAEGRGTQVQRGGGHRCRAEGDTGAGDEAALRGPVPTCRLVMGISVNK